MKVQQNCSVDVVIDTNALSHSEQRSVSFHSSALQFLQWMASAGQVKWMLDDIGKSAPNVKTSILASEYYATLAPQGFAMSLFVSCLASGRVSFSKLPDARTKQIVRSLVPRNKKDQAVLGAAIGCSDRVLVSNDYADFSSDVRVKCGKQLGVLILDTDEAAA